MNFDTNKFVEYKKLQDTTNIQDCYQHTIQALKYICSKLEEEMTNYHFMNRFVENQMNFSYFQLTNDSLKNKKLKIQVIFVHKTCTFEVWISGYNRKTQKNYYSSLPNELDAFEKCADPLKNDYLLKKKLSRTLTRDDIQSILLEIKDTINLFNKTFSNQSYI